MRDFRLGHALLVGTILVCCGHSPVHGELAHAKKSNQVTKRAAGSAAMLQGQVQIYHIFCDDEESTWTDAQRQETFQTLIRACTFISRQAAAHGQQIAFRHEIGPRADFRGHVPLSHESDPIWTQQILEAVFDGEPIEFVRQLKARQGADHVAFCLHVHKSALSYNLASYEGVDERFEAERAVCFTHYPDGRPTSAATYAHELLHLFGAGDLYFPYDPSPDRKERAESLFPNDIMLRVDYNLRALTIGPYTAYRIGWHDSLASQLAVFDD